MAKAKKSTAKAAPKKRDGRRKRDTSNVGRPTKLTPQVHAAIVGYVETFGSIKDAGILVGLCHRTAKLWYDKGSKEKSGIYAEYFADVARAQTDWKLRQQEKIQESKDWKAQWALLKKEFPAEFADPKTVQHTGASGGPIQIRKTADEMTDDELVAIAQGIEDG